MCSASLLLPRERVMSAATILCLAPNAAPSHSLPISLPLVELPGWSQQPVTEEKEGMRKAFSALPDR